MSCNCENSTCKEPHVHPDAAAYGGIRVGRCLNATTGNQKIEWLGDVCPACYDGYPEKYRITNRLHLSLTTKVPDREYGDDK